MCGLEYTDSKPHTLLDACLKRLGITTCLPMYGSCNDFHTTKSDVNVYIRAAGKIGVPVDEVLFLDDNYHANKTAGKAGLKTCGVYDPSSSEFVEEIKNVSDYYIRFS